ncbi:MAG: TRAP transporter substrate-binding protein [Alphaproteobacteria bacterium]|nr:TRAP transporter substrate-binding protein [Alphaproteobacteria bacterium]
MKRRDFLATAAAGAALMGAGATASAQQARRWAIATPYPDGNFHTQNLRTFLQEVQQGTNNRMQFQVHSNAALLTMLQIKRGIQTGQVQMGEILMSAYGNEDPFFEVDSVPFLAPTWELSDKLNELTAGILRRKFEAQGLMLLYLVPWPSQGFYSRAPINSVEDFRGVKLRAYNALTSRMAQLMGATPTTVQQAEVPQAFATGIITHMYTSAQTGVDTQAWDYARYFYDVGGNHTRNAILVNMREWRRLDDSTRTLMLQAADTASRRGRAAAQKAEMDRRAELGQRGMTIGQPTERFLSQMREIGNTIANEWAQKAGDEGRRVVAAMRS